MGCIIGDFKYILKVADNIAKAELKKNKIPVLPQHIIIFHLVGNEHVKFTDLQLQIQCSKSTLSDAINKYEDLGLIEKFECDLDKRNVYIELTDDGKKVWNQLIDIDNIIRSMMFKGLDQDQADEIEKQVNLISRNLM